MTDSALNEHEKAHIALTARIILVHSVQMMNHIDDKRV